MDNQSKKEINEFRFKSLVPLIHSYRKIKRKKILDFGCGSGHSTFAMALEGGECTGIDISKSCILAAHEKHRQDFKDYNINFIHYPDTTSLSFADQSFDIVTCNAVFEHIFPWQRESHFREIYRVIKPGGTIVLRGTPNRYFPNDGHTSELWFVPWLPLWIAKYYVILRNGAIKKTDKIAQQNMRIIDKLKAIPDDEWYRRGIRGVGFRDVQSWINDNKMKLELLNSNNLIELKRYFRNSNSWGKYGYIDYPVYSLVGILNLFSISIHNILPYLNLIFHRKDNI